MSTEPKVEVLMSTFNGETFVRAQLESILQQLPADGKISIRDDGSTDHTLAIIEDMDDPRIVVSRGVNLGFGPSFMTLIEQADRDSDMIMLADQDDVWFSDKIERSWNALRNIEDQPGLYCTAQRLVDSDLNPLNDTQPWRHPPAFENALIENIVTGCTAAFNKKSLRLLQGKIQPTDVYFHDWWLYIVISALGRVIYDPNPSLLYRQHDRNVIGHGRGWLGRQIQMIRFLLKHDWAEVLLRQLLIFNRNYRNLLSDEQRNLIDCHFSINGDRIHPRRQMIMGGLLWRQQLIHEIPLRVLLIIHQIRTKRRSIQSEM